MSDLLPDLPSDHDLRTKYVRGIIDQLLDTYNFGGELMKFLPYRYIAEIAHESTIDHVLLTDESRQDLARQGDDTLKDLFQTKAVRAFAIFLYSGMPWNAFKQILLAIAYSDEALPLTSRPSDMSLEHFERFEKDQYIFLAPVFLQGHFNLKLTKKIPIPIEFSEDDFLGTGAEGEVYKAQIDPDHHNFSNFQEPLALKQTQTVIRSHDELSILHFLAATSIATDKHIALAYAGFEFNGHNYIIAEKVCADLDKFMHANPRGYHSDTQNLTRKWFLSQLRGLASALTAVHTAIPGYRISHGDLRSDNILVRQRHAAGEGSCEYVFMLNDWGLAVAMPLLTNRNVAREVEPQQDLRKNDVHDLGVIFLDLLVWYTQGHGAVSALRKGHDSARWNALFEKRGRQLDQLEKLDNGIWASQIGVLRGMLAPEEERWTAARVVENLP